MEFNNKVPIYIQVMNEIKLSIIKGEISLGQKLPSARELALKYNINPNTANRIYREMEAENICYTKRGLGTYVTEETALIQKIRDEMLSKLLETFILGMKVLNFSYDDIIDCLNKNYHE